MIPFVDLKTQYMGTKQEIYAAIQGVPQSRRFTLSSEVTLKGYPITMRGIQVNVLRVRLRHLDAWAQARRACAALYDKLQTGNDAQPPHVVPAIRHLCHIYAVRTMHRLARIEALPTPFASAACARQSWLWEEGLLPHYERANKVLSQPIYPEVTVADCEKVARAVRAA